MPAPVLPAGPLHGRVASFDDARGLGTLVAADGTTLAFHATAIADGSRTIAVGTHVTFTTGPGHGGRYEARSLEPASHQEPS